MMKKILILILCFSGFKSLAQTDSLPVIPVVVHKDFRLDLLAKKEFELNGIANKLAARSGMGYRLQVLSTNDRDLAMRTRTQLLQRFPDQKVYMLFLAPYVKLRFGNFQTKQEAETYKNQISRMLGGASVYIVSERIEIKPGTEKKTVD